MHNELFIYVRLAVQLQFVAVIHQSSVLIVADLCECKLRTSTATPGLPSLNTPMKLKTALYQVDCDIYIV